jgi:hypothetical protein
MSDIAPRLRCEPPKTLASRKCRAENRLGHHNPLLAFGEVIQEPTESAREVERERGKDRPAAGFHRHRSSAAPRHPAARSTEVPLFATLQYRFSPHRSAGRTKRGHRSIGLKTEHRRSGYIFDHPPDFSTGWTCTIGRRTVKAVIMPISV